MVQVDLPGAFAVGQIFAILSRKYLIKTDSKFDHKLMAPLNWYLTFIFAPVGMFLLVGWPGWECMYWWRCVERPMFRPFIALFYVLFYVAMVAIGNLSYILAHHLYLKGKDKLVNVLAVIGVIGTFLPFVLWPFTWLHVGTYSQYHAIPRETTNMFRIPSFFVPWLLIMSYFVIGTVLFGLWLKRKANRLV
jgi:hypothetical protein